MERGNPEFVPLMEREKAGLEVASSTEGKIEEVVMSSGIYRGPEDESSKNLLSFSYNEENGDFKGERDVTGIEFIFIKDVLATLPSGTKLKIFVQKDEFGKQKKFLEEWRDALKAVGIDQDRVDMEVVESWKKAYAGGWMRDYMLLSADGERVFIPRCNTSQRDQSDLSKFSTDVAKKLKLEPLQCPFYFEGGDVKVDNERLFVGALSLIGEISLDSEERKIKPAKNDNALIEEKISKMQNFFGGEVVLVGRNFLNQKLNNKEFPTFSNSTQREILMPPLFHLDLYFTPLGNNQVAIGDVDLLVDLVKKQSDSPGQSFLNSVEQVRTSIVQQLDGFVSEKYSSIFRMADVFSGDFIDYLNEGSQSVRGREFDVIKRYLNSVADEAAAAGMEVVRLPFLPSIYKRDITNGAFITYNNSLVENYEEEGNRRRRIWIPTFGPKHGSRKLANGERVATDMLNIIDNEAARILRRIGFEVVPVGSGMEKTLLGGSLNCKFLDIRNKKK